MRTEYADLSTEKLDEAIRRYHKRYHEIKDDPKKDLKKNILEEQMKIYLIEQVNERLKQSQQIKDCARCNLSESGTGEFLPSVR
jgi:fatty-acid desaturase